MHHSSFLIGSKVQDPRSWLQTASKALQKSRKNSPDVVLFNKEITHFFLGGGIKILCDTFAVSPLVATDPDPESESPFLLLRYSPFQNFLPKSR